MKKSIALVTLIILLVSCKSASSSTSFLGSVKYNQAVLTFEDGTVKKGFAEMVDMPFAKIKFRSTEKGDTEMILSDELKKVDYIDKEGNKYEAVRLYFNKDKGEKGIKKGEKVWVYLLYNNGMKLASSRSASTFRYNPSNGTSTGSGGSTMVFIGKENEDGIFYLYSLEDQISINTGMDKAVEKNCELLFKNCPKFLEAIKAENFKKNTLINRLIELYEASDCNKLIKVEKKKKTSSKKK